MNTVQPSYSYTQKARGLYAVLATGFAALLAVLFIFTRSPVFVACGTLLALLVISGIYAFFKGETWSMRIEDGMLSWAYARWPKSSGTIELSTVCTVVVNDWGSTIEFTFSDGSSRRLKLIGHAAKLRDYLVAHYPHINVKFVEGS